MLSLVMHLCCRSVHVEKCSRCVLVLGATSSAVEVANCDSLTIIAASRRVHIRFAGQGMWCSHGNVQVDA